MKEDRHTNGTSRLGRIPVDASPAQWVVDSIVTHYVDVNSLLPAMFDAYARVFHQPEEDENGPVRLGDVTAANGRIAYQEIVRDSGAFDGCI